MTKALQPLHPHVQPHGLTAGNWNLRACAVNTRPRVWGLVRCFQNTLQSVSRIAHPDKARRILWTFIDAEHRNTTQLTTLLASMLTSPGEAACNCTIASARLLLEASGFVVSGRHSLYTSYSASKRDEVFTMYCAIVAGLVLIAGLMSGLTLGLMSLDGLDLEV